MARLLERYFGLQDEFDKFGKNPLDPVSRSIWRKMYKLYKQMSPDDRRVVDFALDPPAPWEY